MPKATTNTCLALPDPLLVRLFREGRLPLVQSVAMEQPSRDVVVTFAGGHHQRFIHLPDLGWIAEVAAD